MEKMKTSAAHPPQPTATSDQTAASKSVFLVLALTMSWQLAFVVLVPVVAGVQLDKALNSQHTWTFVGLGLAVIGSIGVMWSTMQRANRLPVPKLTAAQKRAVQKQYEEDDADV
jgi:hypothetical protein